MTIPTRRINTPVKREGAERYLLLSLVSFAMSVIVTRTFLELTGYPQLGNSELHIAHVLWGGLLLFIASLLPLIFANRWAFNTSAILSGVGVGLFIDEVGKFITQNNDYFYPAAAPIIYAFFLLTVLLYLQVRRPPTRNPRAELYRIFDEMTEVLDYDLDAQERAAMDERLHRVADQTDDPNLKRLIPSLIDFLHEEKVHVIQPVPTYIQRMRHYTTPVSERVITRRSLKWFLVLSLGIMGVLALIEFGVLIAAVTQSGLVLETLITPLVTRGELHSAAEATWALARIFLEGVTGVLLIVSGGLFTIGKERAGVHLATLTLIVWLTVINLLVFYLDQFGAIATTLVQFLVLTGVTYYRRRFLNI